MRNELELIATIEKYLNNEMTAAEKAAFEQNIANDPQLQEAVTLQQEVMKGIDNLTLKQHIQQARTRFYRIRNFTRWGLGGLVVIAAVVSVMFYLKPHHTFKDKEQVTPELPNADKRQPSQVFLINAAIDTIVETKGGLVIQIPANGFLDENKQPVTGNFELSVHEALDAASIMQAGLSSTSRNQLLESAGMFRIEARKNGNNLMVNPASGLHIELPADTLKPGMQLFKGNRLADGRIDWVDPKPLELDLTPVDILSLNFYPPGYLDSLAKWGYDSRNKKFTDSLYYSLSDWFQYAEYLDEGEEADSSQYRHALKPCGINPAKIKAIWNNKFQNTLLATREFEERLVSIFQSGDNIVLDLYINNLDKKLSVIDSMAAGLVPVSLKQQFLAYAARHDGKVKVSSALTQQLRRYYETKTKIIMEAVAKTNRGFWEKQRQLDSLSTARQAKHTNDSQERTARIFNEELQVNLKSVYRQLGYDTSITPRVPKKVYKIEIRATGWYNVDRFVYETTASRTTGSYTDPGTGKTATIKYLPFSIQVNKPEQYDSLYVYLLPGKLSSFMRLARVNGKFAENLNESLTYKLVCIAYTGDQPFYYVQPGIEAKEYTGINLSAITQQDLTRLLNKEANGQQQSDLQKEVEFYQFYKNDQKRKKRNVALNELRFRVFQNIYHCILSS